MKKLITFALIGLNLLATIGGSAMIYMTTSEPLVEKPAKSEMSTEEYLIHNKIFDDKPIIFTLDPFTVNLSNVEEDKKVLVEVNIELNDENSFHEVKSSSAAVRDAVVTILSKHEHADIATVQGKLSLKDEIATAINQHLKTSMIRGIYFTKFFVE
jgi:flagellar protein FliL